VFCPPSIREGGGAAPLKTAKEPGEKHRLEPYFNFGGRKFFNHKLHLYKMKNIKEWQSWLKISGIISLVIIVVDIVILLLLWIPCYTRSCDGFIEGILAVFILLPILGIVIGCWVIGFLIHYLKNNNKK